jgi:hypothetical protein
MDALRVHLNPAMELARPRATALLAEARDLVGHARSVG